MLFDDIDWFRDNTLSSALTCQGLLLDSLEDSRQSLIKNDVVLSEGLTDAFSRIEHSYSYSIASDGDSIPSSPLSLDLQDDMDQECFPCIPMKKANQQDSSFTKNDTNLFIKRETLSPPPSNNPPFTTSTHPVTSSNTRLTNNLATGYNNNQMPDLVRSNQQVNKLSGDGCNRKESNLKRGACSGGMVMNNNSCMNKPNLAGRKIIKQEPDIHVQVKTEPGSLGSKQNPYSLLKPSQPIARLICPKVTVKLEDSSPSSISSQVVSSPGFTSTFINPISVNTGKPTITTTFTSSQLNNSFSSNNSSLQRSITTSSLQPQRSITASSLQQQHLGRQRILPAVRQTINSPLISTQLKGSSGMICLTEEEKRTLISEGYPVPTKLPLTKSEERSLKKIRRKIKNKISAQESRRKKKEYMDSLERKYDIMQNEANKWRSKAEELEAKNMQLAQQIAALQDQLQERSSSIPVMSKHMEDNCTYMVPVHAVHQVPSTELEDKCSGGQFSDLSSNCLDLD